MLCIKLGGIEMEFSQELKQILNTKIGYRNEGYSGSGETDVRDVIKFEMYELGNEDILDFFKENYGLSVSCEDYQEALEAGQISEEEVDEIIDQMMLILHEKFGHKDLSCLWLTTLEGVKSNYLCGEEYVSQYCLEGITIVPISDLGDQGILLVMDKHPDFIPNEIVYVEEESQLITV